MTKKYLGVWAPCTSWICMDKEKCKNEEQTRTLNMSNTNKGMQKDKEKLLKKKLRIFFSLLRSSLKLNVLFQLYH